jgi:hypothetical protein
MLIKAKLVSRLCNCERDCDHDRILLVAMTST